MPGRAGSERPPAPGSAGRSVWEAPSGSPDRLGRPSPSRSPSPRRAAPFRRGLRRAAVGGRGPRRGIACPGAPGPRSPAQPGAGPGGGCCRSRLAWAPEGRRGAASAPCAAAAELETSREGGEPGLRFASSKRRQVFSGGPEAAARSGGAEERVRAQLGDRAGPLASRGSSFAPGAPRPFLIRQRLRTYSAEGLVWREPWLSRRDAALSKRAPRFWTPA